MHNDGLIENPIDYAMVMNKHIDNFMDILRFSLSHELRAPVKTIVEFIKIIHIKFANELPADLARFIDIVGNAADDMNELILSLVEFLSITRHTIEISAANVNETVSTILKKQCEQAGHANVEIICPALLDCQADKKLLSTVFNNLISNAFKFSKKCPQPRIEMGSQVNQDTIIYFVKDNGVGIDIKYQHKLFKPFVKLHQDPDFPGVGLGLSIVQQIMERHGGKIWIQSQSNEGATFFFELKK